MKRAATAIGALAMVATFATACGSSDSSADSNKSAATTEAPTTTTASADAPTEAQLSSALLTADDMGAGWVVDPSDSEPGCLSKLFADGTIPGPKVDTQFIYSAPNADAHVFEGLAYAGDDDSEAVFTEVKTTLGGCAQSATNPDGPTSITPLEFPSYGEQSAAWTAEFVTNDQTITVYLVAALQNNVIVLTTGGQTAGTMDPAALEPVVNLAVEKLAQAAQAS